MPKTSGLTIVSVGTFKGFGRTQAYNHDMESWYTKYEVNTYFYTSVIYKRNRICQTYSFCRFLVLNENIKMP